MSDLDFINAALEAGFTRAQAKFLDEALAKRPHTHEIEEIEGLPETLEELGVETVDEDEEE